MLSKRQIFFIIISISKKRKLDRNIFDWIYMGFLWFPFKSGRKQDVLSCSNLHNFLHSFLESQKNKLVDLWFIWFLSFIISKNIL